VCRPTWSGAGGFMQIIELPDTPITVSGAIVPVATEQ
jgi:hypothetical protein